MYQNHLGELSEVKDPRYGNWNHKSTGLSPSRKWILQNASSSTSAWPLSSLQPNSGLFGTPGPATFTLLPRFPLDPQTLVFSSPLQGSFSSAGNTPTDPGGRCLSSRPHLLSQRLHFSNFPTPSPQVHKEGRTRDSNPALRRPLRYPALQTHPLPPPPPPRRCEGGAQEAGRREAHLRGRELAAPPGRCRACHQGAASCNRSRFSTLHSPRGRAPCLNSKSQPCTQQPFFSSSPAGLGR